jgi:hypothetical protein
MTESFDLVPAALAVKAMRDNGYRNAAYALAELIDNSVQAGAKSVELLCAETEVFVAARSRRNLSQVAVLDNGSGMDAATLRMALQFGNGTRLDDRSGIGRFGMGLPSASISQCKRADVWSWTSGVESALHTYIDVDEITAGEMKVVPEPAEKKVPKIWRAAASQIGESGTLVVWSKIDRCMWKTGLTVIKNSEFLVGRMYRYFIHDRRVKIRMASFIEDKPKSPISDRFAVANDPGYLLTGTSTPEPFDKTPMFEPDGDNNGEQTITIDMHGREHFVVIRYSVAKKEAREGANAGSTSHGKHASNNVGVSLVRAQRELALDQSLTIAYDPRERWWGVEVDFPPSLDELFGVTNNKQEARNFTEIAGKLQELLSGEQSVAEVKAQMEEDGDPRLALVEIVDSIDRRLRTIRNQIKVQKQGTGRKVGPRHVAELRATEVTADMKERGQSGESDVGEQRPSEERTKELQAALVEDGLDKDDAHEIAVDAISMGIKYVLTKGDLEGSAFFTVRPIAGEIVVKLNINHPAYIHLVEALDDDPQNLPNGAAELKERLEKAAVGLRLLLLAWARFEDEQPAQRRMDVQDIRSDWGRYASKFLHTGE